MLLVSVEMSGFKFLHRDYAFQALAQITGEMTEELAPSGDIYMEYPSACW